MRNHSKWLIVGALVLGLLILSVLLRGGVDAPTYSGDGDVVTGEIYRLTSVVNDQVVFAEQIEITGDASVRGDAAFIGESIAIDGSISGDLTATGETVRLGSGSRVGGDATLLGSRVELAGRIGGELTVHSETLVIAPGTEVDGGLIACVDSLSGSGRSVNLRPCSEGSPWRVWEAVVPVAPGVLIAISAVFSAFALAAVSAGTVTVFPRHISHIEEAMRSNPRRVLVIGILAGLLALLVSYLVVLVLAVAGDFDLLLVPLFLLAWLVVVGMTLSGVVTLALILGEWLLARVSSFRWPPLVATAVGAAALAAGLFLPLLLPFGVWVSLVLVLLLSACGLGGALATRLGTRSPRRTYFVQG